MKTTFVFVLMGFMTAPLDADSRAPLFFREDFTESPPATPATQDHVVNKDLRLGLYGPGKDGVKKSHHDKPADDPYYLWTGTCEGNCAVTLRHNRAFADLTGDAKIRWRTRQEGFRRLHLVVKLSDGKWYVSEQADGESDTWRVTELQLPSIQWRTLDIVKVIEGARANPDLSRVDEIGFTDLMTGGASRACSRVDWIEVYGASVPR
jgi:hypothetical protein